MMLAHGMEAAFFGFAFWATLLVFALGVFSLWQVRSTSTAQGARISVPIVTVLASIPLVLLDMMEVFSPDAAPRAVVWLAAVLAWLALLMGCIGLGLSLSRRKP